MHCPKCGFEQLKGAMECPQCGVVFAKYFAAEVARAAEIGDDRAPAAAPVRTTARRPVTQSAPLNRVAMPDIYDGYAIKSAEEELAKLDEVRDGTIGPGELKILGIGLAAAIVVYALPFTRFVFSAIVTLFHEFGHAVAGWLLGYPALPAFDLMYGGGITHYGEFHVSIAIAVGAVFAWLAWTFRLNRKALTLILIIFAAWLIVVTGEWRRELVAASAGHLAEFILAGIMLYKALSGVGLRAPEVERPVAAFVAFFVQIHSMFFALKLSRDADFLAWYREGKGGMLMNDLETVALDLQIYTKMSPGIQGVAKMLLVFSFVPIAVAIVWYLQRARWWRVLRSLKTVDAPFSR